MAEEDGIDSIQYRDAHGVWWRIVTPPGGRMFAHMDQDSKLRYAPEPTDVGPVSRLRVVGENAAEERQVLQQDIEDAVKDLRPELLVTAEPEAKSSSGGWLLVAGLVVLLAARRRR